MITLPGPTILARYIAYADDVVKSNDKIDKVGKKIQMYETVAGTKIKICWLVVGSWKGYLPSTFKLDGRLLHLTRRLVGSRPSTGEKVAVSIGKSHS